MEFKKITDIDINNLVSFENTVYTKKPLVRELNIIAEDYLKKYNKKWILIDTQSDYNSIKYVCKSLNDKVLKKFLYNNGEPFIFSAEFADKMFIDIVNKDREKYEYMHVIACHIYDIWNIKYDDPVFLCYHKNFGDLKIQPSEEEIYLIWNRMF
jgi:hypothetical protein